MCDSKEKIINIFKIKKNVSKDKMTEDKTVGSVIKVIRVEKDVIKSFSNKKKIFTNRVGDALC